MASQEQPGLADLKSAAVDTSPEQWESMDDDRSSSLSEPEDPTEERDIVVPDEVEEESASDAENDTEAETERLDISPQKWLKVQVEEVDEDKAKEDAEAQIDEMEQDQEDVDAASTGTHTREPTPDILKATEPETMPRKRKRAAGLTDPLMTGEDPDEPAAKRSHSSQEESIADPEEEREPEEPDPDENVDEEIAEQLVEELAAQAQPELEPEVEVEEKEDAVIEQEEPEKPSRALRFRKGKRKGKKVKDPELDRASGTPRLGPVEGEDVVEEEADEEDPNAIQEEEALTKRKFALDMLGEVERQFIAFKERHLNEQINHINKELELLNEPDCQHSEYLAMLQCIDERRTNKVQHEHIHKRYRMQTLRIKVVGERSQLQSQLLQDLRVAREKALEDGYKYFHALQRDRRRFGADDTNYMHMFPTKRSTQVEQQTAYNLEVSILSGIAKHVGFPAAPDMKGLDDAEIESDLQAMKIAHRPVHPVHPVRPLGPTPILDVARETRVAEEQFLSQTPWANPHHPAHQNATYQPFAAPSTTQPPASKPPGDAPFVTPTTQRTLHDPGSHPAAANSASTIEMPSHPNSGVAGQPPNSHHRTQRESEAESPSVKVKWHGEDWRWERPKRDGAGREIEGGMGVGGGERDLGGSAQREMVQVKATSPPKDAGGDWGSAMRSGIGPLAVGAQTVSASR